MDYRKELEALMIETVALTSRTPPTVPQRSPVVLGLQAPIDLVVSIPNEPSRQAPRPYNYGPPEREQISKRIEKFKAHQERFRREREDYCSQVMKRVRDAAAGRTLPDD
ncbi:hypothetical protein [Bradyrhizobium sp. BR13661]|jgi:hypothetical protein|uniref:hypothetical protein n=1 Tax=Bradyrhizobium sp. BR13661 TaxID=2940622 RepID=UPI0024769B0A|nr:hypothetical protein [Bradyrhizobium sp. BR13661]MDH6263366.1 hypothetical protein [Bradyrhizobium sp. BR13661]